VLHSVVSLFFSCQTTVGLNKLHYLSGKYLSWKHFVWESNCSRKLFTKCVVFVWESTLLGDVLSEGLSFQESYCPGNMCTQNILLEKWLSGNISCLIWSNLWQTSCLQNVFLGKWLGKHLITTCLYVFLSIWLCESVCVYVSLSVCLSPTTTRSPASAGIANRPLVFLGIF